jgi:nucleoside-diphosphate-sugar epimerase
MRVLVLGAGGFIGRHLFSILSREGFAPVAGVHRQPAGDGKAEHVRVDVLDAASLRDALQGCDAVVNCTAGNAATIAEGTRLLFDAAAAMSTKPFVVHLSTMSVYGSATGTLAESAPVVSDSGWYGEAKIRAEAHAARYAAQGGPMAILRPGIVYGPGSQQWSGRIATLLRAGRLGDLGAAGDGHCNLVHVDDVAAAVVRVLHHPAARGGTFNLADPAAGTWNRYFIDYARALDYVPVRRLSGRRLKIEGKLIAPPLKILQILAGKAGMAGRIPEPIPPSLVRLFAQDLRLDVTKAESELGLRWTALADGLAQAADWARSGT